MLINVMFTNKKHAATIESLIWQFQMCISRWNMIGKNFTVK